MEARNSSGEPRELPEAPVGVPDSYEEHMKLMFDLQLLAFQSDLTRVFSFKWGRDSSNRIFPESGVDRPIHPASHHGNNEERILEWNKLHQWADGECLPLTYWGGSLQASQEGDGQHSLDRTIDQSGGSPMGDREPPQSITALARLSCWVGANGKAGGETSTSGARTGPPTGETPCLP